MAATQQDEQLSVEELTTILSWFNALGPEVLTDDMRYEGYRHVDINAIYDIGASVVTMLISREGVVTEPDSIMILRGLRCELLPRLEGTIRARRPNIAEAFRLYVESHLSDIPAICWYPDGFVCDLNDWSD